MNTKLNICPVVLLRIPAFSITDELPEVWDELKVAISHSSIDFYHKIKAVEATEIKGLDAKMQFSIWKYYNRSKYRGTPFGQFAGFAVASLGTTKERLVFSKSQHFHRFKDWSQYKGPKLSEFDLSASERVYFSNSSHYRVADHIRFISLDSKAFELSEVAYSVFIQDLLLLCAKKVSYEVVLKFALSNGITEEVLLGMLTAMIEAQLLFTDLNANLIGPDYFQRNGQMLQESTGDYLIAEREMISGKLNATTIKHLPSCISSLNKLQFVDLNEGLKHFILNFNKRYEGRLMPLMQLMDPELGIGYGDFTSTVGSISLAQELSGNSVVNRLPGLKWTDFSLHLVKAMLNVNRSQVLQLKDIINTSVEEKVLKIANSFSVLARYAGDLVILDSIGGCTANALAGRFTLVNESFAQHCKSIAKAESAANPEVIFFDIAYMAEGKVDNINRRKQIYEYELPILNYSCSDKLIGLEDILVTVQGSEVILFSKQYEKRLIPRLASAYNYSRSDLSVYRFLCDLQHQGIQSQLLFNVQELLPGLDYYPRIQYENLVLSPAKWRLKREDLQGVELSVVLENMGISACFSVGDGDQTLCFDKSKSDDLMFLKQYANQYNDFVVTEVICPDVQQFNDEYKKCYFTQVLLSMSHQEQIYSGFSWSDFSQDQTMESVIMPGKDWLYYEIYCHPDRTNFLLSTKIDKFIKTHEASFKTWFFIRYNDPSPHVRLRIQMRDQQAGYAYMTKLMKLLEPGLKDGWIKDVQLKTYHQEIARYGALQMELTEQHFKRDSHYALQIVKVHASDLSIYRDTIMLMKMALKILNLEAKVLLEFVRGVQRAFEKEHELKAEDFKMVNREWINFRAQDQSADSDLQLPLRELLYSFTEVLNATAGQQQQSLFCSLFHMHINRLFSDYQRAHELLIYSFLYKQLQMEQLRPALV